MKSGSIPLTLQYTLQSLILLRMYFPTELAFQKESDPYSSFTFCL